MEFDTIEDAVKYIKDILRLDKIDYSCGSYSYGEKGQLRMIAEHTGRQVVVKPEVNGWYKYGERIKVQGNYIASLAILKLFAEGKEIAAKAIANCLTQKVAEIVFNLEKPIDREMFFALCYYGATSYIHECKRAECSIEMFSLVPADYLNSALDEISEYHLRRLETGNQG